MMTMMMLPRPSSGDKALCVTCKAFIPIYACVDLEEDARESVSMGWMRVVATSTPQHDNRVYHLDNT